MSFLPTSVDLDPHLRSECHQCFPFGILQVFSAARESTLVVSSCATVDRLSSFQLFLIALSFYNSFLFQLSNPLLTASV
jgi:hypothetical protein